MKKSASADTALTINGVASSPPESQSREPCWTIYTDDAGASGSFVNKINVGSINVLGLVNGVRTLYTSGSITLINNASYIFQYVASDNRMLLIHS
jgi:hypothetical protein